MTKIQLESLRVQIAERLDAMVPSIFTPEMRLTFIARHPTNPECFVVVTDDGDIREAAKLLGRPADDFGNCNACGFPNKPDGCCSRSGCYNSD